MTPQDEAARRKEVEIGLKAQSLLDNAYFKSVIEFVRDTIYGDFAGSAYDDDQKRRYARIKLGMLDDLLKTIRSDKTTGDLASEQLRRERERVEREQERRKSYE